MVQRIVDLRVPFGLRVLFAERHGAQSNDAHLDFGLSESSVFHS
jgi:hypothetical protein